ncbi:Predicted nucleic-acid-binding protein containing a Zn-ribbon [Bordetella ansorpii]|uniref:Predicted nucleic-acid-binding protein containing a Zn-ribbon n=1 Tax=Bordetella ansorpii TaxID=288768 RepID=A0A157S4H7_9BORD|nr:OB-fold domain-containing protein [Bordetella ansorpii]SAI65317.1 Predicted nucleic-acid-binding protein containing a Zn-ribbon [Bordetella ansorpii]
MSQKPGTPQGSQPAGPEKHYHDLLSQGRFQIQRCHACKQAVFYPRAICPHCGDPRLDWFTPSGKGTVYSTTVVRRRAEHGGDYNVALVDLAEGPRMMSRVDGIAPEAVKIGMAVQVRLIDTPDGKLVVFQQEGRA